MALTDWISWRVTSGGTGVLGIEADANFPTPADVIPEDEDFTYVITSEGLEPVELGVGRRTAAGEFTRVSNSKTFIAGTYDSSPEAFANISIGMRVVCVADASLFNFLLESVQELNTYVGILNIDAARLASDNIFIGNNQFNKSANGRWGTETYAASHTINLDDIADTIDLAGNITFNAISGNTTGDYRHVVRRMVQDPTGGRTASFNTSVFDAPNGIFPILSTAANAVDYLVFMPQPDGTCVAATLYPRVS